ncbi:hypothetical protein ACHMW5_11775 [Azospirillum melinis]|uniref:hypothetical protein n=1 Tax=Azospirillum melinis TaxID=328839 RepID=UPI003757D753
MPKDNIPGRDAKLNSMLQMVFSNNPNESWAAVSKVRSYLEARGRTPRDIEAFTGDDFAGGLMAELRQRQNTIDRLRNEKLELIKRKKEVGRPKKKRAQSEPRRLKIPSDELAQLVCKICNGEKSKNKILSEILGVSPSSVARFLRNASVTQAQLERLEAAAKLGMVEGRPV